MQNVQTFWCIAILLLFTACGEENPNLEEHNSLIAEYNEQSAKIDALVAEHNQLLDVVRGTIGNHQQYSTAIQKYLYFADANKQAFSSYETFVRNNASFFQEKEVDTADLQAQLRDVVNTIEQNSRDFRKYLENPLSTQTTTITKTQGRKFKTVPLYR